MDKIIYYIDGLNLYRGLEEAKLQDYYWLDIAKLSISMNADNQELVKVKYFTSMFSEENDSREDDPKVHLQKIYLKALDTFENIEIIKGRHQSFPVKCKRCGYVYNRYEEKLTDVNIACEMIDDAYNKNCNLIGLISADCDLKPAIEKIFKLFKDIKVFAIFPPKRYSVELKDICNSCRVISRTLIRNCLLPDYVINKRGTKIFNPEKYEEHFREENPF